MENFLQQVIRTAIKMETDGMEFYEKARDKTSHPFGKEMFLSFKKDEERHLNVLKKILAELDLSGFEKYFGKTPREKIRTIFNQIKDKMQQRIAANPDEMETLKIGIEMEKESIRFYKSSLEKTVDPRAKILLEKLILEEKDHYSILENTHSFLEDSGKWFLWEEKALIDGG